MASLVRIKRRQSQEPAEALLLAAKRMKTESGADGGADKGGQIEKSVFNFCGSTDNAVSESVFKHVGLNVSQKFLCYRKTMK